VFFLDLTVLKIRRKRRKKAFTFNTRRSAEAPLCCLCCLPLALSTRAFGARESARVVCFRRTHTSSKRGARKIFEDTAHQQQQQQQQQQQLSSLARPPPPTSRLYSSPLPYKNGDLLRLYVETTLDREHGSREARARPKTQLELTRATRVVLPHQSNALAPRGCRLATPARSTHSSL